jgi:sec-independent protein translocase protein TatB
MFDVGFWELCLIAVVALVVLGPERLPRAARTAGFLLGKARRAAADMKAEIERELDIDDLKRMKEQQEAKLRDVIDDTRSALTRTPIQERTQPPPDDHPAARKDDENASR